jgi:hypothetical protein
MKTTRQVFATLLDDEAIELLYVDGIGINASLGTVEHDVFIPTREADRFLFSDHPHLRGMFTERGWNMRTVTEFIFGVAGTVIEEDVETFNEWMKSL